MKIADFGFSRSVDRKEETLTSIVGTPYYMSPQVLYGQAYSKKTDVWSLGVILFQLVMGHLPF